ncbi:hypothetical protein ACP275_08G214800 [Erythranthe tilingii]
MCSVVLTGSSCSTIKNQSADPVRRFPLNCGNMSPSNMKCPKIDVVSVKRDPRKSVVGQKMADKDENKVRLLKESWECESEKLAAVIAEAKRYINEFDAKHKYTESKKSEKRARENHCPEFQDFDEKKMKVEEDDSEEEVVCVLSPAEWTGSKSGFKNGVDSSKGKIGTNPRGVSDCQVAETKRGEKNMEKSRKSKTLMEVCVLDDVSGGREKLPIRALNGVDEERPPPFTYDTIMEYPYWYRLINPVGCDCVDGCSDSEPCACVLKNGGEIPFNENGKIIRAKPIVHECGPLCKCPPSCMNRVSQNGPRYKLEIFKTESRGWGVRSPSYISSGSFICEYIGKLLRDKEAEKRVGKDEYLFDICDDSHEEEGQGKVCSNEKSSVDGFAIDAALYGNVGRFINHSCSPNLYAQEVLYDHDDKRMPHVMFFASKNIHPMKELSYDYNYKMDRICDVNGNIKTKDCHCGSRKCTGRMY